MVKEIAKCWRALTKDQKIPFKEAARKGKFYFYITNEIIDKERYDKALKQLEGKSENLHKPKKCLSAYMIFVKETRPKIVT